MAWAAAIGVWGLLERPQEGCGSCTGDSWAAFAPGRPFGDLALGLPEPRNHFPLQDETLADETLECCQSFWAPELWPCVQTSEIKSAKAGSVSGQWQLLSSCSSQLEN